VAEDAVGQDHVVAQQTFFHGAEAFNGVLGGKVAQVGLELDADAAQGFKGVFEEQVFGLGIDGGALVGDTVPGAANFQGAVVRADIQVAGAADRLTAGKVDNGKGEVGAVLLAVEHIQDPGAQVFGGFDPGVNHELPDAGVQTDQSQVGEVRFAERLEADEATGEGEGVDVHEGHEG